MNEITNNKKTNNRMLLFSSFVIMVLAIFFFFFNLYIGIYSHEYDRTFTIDNNTCETEGCYQDMKEHLCFNGKVYRSDLMLCKCKIWDCIK